MSSYDRNKDHTEGERERLYATIMETYKNITIDVKSAKQVLMNKGWGLLSVDWKKKITSLKYPDIGQVKNKLISKMVKIVTQIKGRLKKKK